MLVKFIKLCLIFILIGGGIILYKDRAIRDTIINYVRSLPNVKGVSTKKIEKAPNNLVSEAEKKVKNTKISDLIYIYNQTRKYAKDFRAFQEYIKKEAENLIKTK